MIGTRRLWDKLENVPQYSYFVDNRIRKYGIDFRIRYIKSPTGIGKIDFLMDKKDWEIILEELKEYKNKRSGKNE